MEIGGLCGNMTEWSPEIIPKSTTGILLIIFTALLVFFVIWVLGNKNGKTRKNKGN